MATDDIPNGLREYLNVDLNPNGPIRQGLLSGLTSEGKQRHFRLTPNLSEHPAGLTDVMLQWYQAHVGPRRLLALQALKSRFESDTTVDGVSGFLLESELDSIEQQKFHNIKAEIDQFEQASDNIALRERARKAAAWYNSLRDHVGGREAREWKPRLYYAGLLSVVVVEGLINFESFLIIPGFTPAFATGSTLAVALFIAYAAHVHGWFIRQFKELMGGTVGATSKRSNWMQFSLATSLLLVALGLVYWGRYNFLRGTLIEAAVLGASALSAWLQLGGGMLGNIGVYLFGVIWSARSHDPMPGYMEARIEKEKLERAYNARRAKAVGKRAQVHIQRASKQAEAKRNAERALRSGPNYTENRALFDRLHAKDLEVLSTFGTYRTQLVGAIRENGRNARFDYDDGTQQKQLTPEEYLGEELRMRYC